MKVCIYAIAKNEISNVDAWYEYAKEADKVVVLDTGSDDGTPERLEELGADVYRKTYPKPFRFDVARNDSVDLAYETDCDIFITTDFDERLNKGWADILKANWNPDIHTRGCYDDFFGDSNVQGSLNWVHDRNWRWMYPCHEVMIRNGVKWYTFDEELDLRGKIILRHYQDTTKSRAQYLPLLKLRLQENPDDSDSWGYYLRELMYAEQWDEMLSLEDEVRAKGFGGAEWAWTLIWIAAAYEQTENIDKAVSLLFESIVADKRFRTAYVSLARLLSEQGKNAMAEGILKQALEDTDLIIRSVFLDADDIWTWRLYDWLSVVCYHQGKLDEAIKWSALALAADPELSCVKHNYECCLRELTWQHKPEA